MNNPQLKLSFKQNLKALPEILSNPLYKNSLLLITTSALTSGLGFIFWIIVARFYNSTDVGYGSAAISAMSLLAFLSLVGVNYTLIRFLPQTDKPVEMINTYLTLCGSISMISAFIFLLGLNIWSPALGFIKENLMFGISFVIFTLAYSLELIVRNIFIARRRADLTLWVDGACSLLKIPLAIVLVLFFHSFGIASAWGVAMSLSVLLALFFFLPKIQKAYRPVPAFNFKILGSLWHYSAGNYIASIFINLPNWVLPIIVLNLSGSAQNAYFYITWMISSLLGVIPIASSNSLFVEGTLLPQKLGPAIRNTLKFTYLLLIPVVIFILFLGPFILTLFGKEYSIQGSELLNIMALTSLFGGLNQVYYSTLRINNRIKELSFICVIPTLMLLIGSYLILPSVGIVGIGYLSLGIQVLLGVYTGFNFRKHFSKKFS